MKLVKTFGRGKAAGGDDSGAGAAAARSIRQGGEDCCAIVTDVRKRGDAALLKYAAKFDGLAKGASLRVSREEMQAAWEATAPELQAAMRVAQANIRAFAEAQRPDEWTFEPADGRHDGTDCAAAGECGLLCSGRALSAAVDAADDGDAGTGGRCGADCGVLAEAGAGDAGSGVAGGSDGVLSRGRGAGDCGDGLWDGDRCAGEQDCGAGEFVCHGGEDDGVAASVASICRRGRRRLW